MNRRSPWWSNSVVREVRSPRSVWMAFLHRATMPGAEYAYAITVRFSQKTVDELEPGLT